MAKTSEFVVRNASGLYEAGAVKECNPECVFWFGS